MYGFAGKTRWRKAVYFSNSLIMKYRRQACDILIISAELQVDLQVSLLSYEVRLVKFGIRFGFRIRFRIRAFQQAEFR